ncbi:glycoside hydrolase [Phakopsora pachyrhizi]|uniref:alpha-1,2-Mannosidase n=1 Tax=Phakopsora pachyrhizi TaxID=170000 RepID=A0AAV0AWG8_PHAPC|nr:glycoside hydrolase [Phakopsora pachyrhizi]
MDLPILHHTSNDAFDPINHFRQLPDSQHPWSTSEPDRASIIKTWLNPNRFSEPDHHTGIYTGSTPPPIRQLPRQSILRPREPELEDPIPIEEIVGLDPMSVWSDRSLVESAEDSVKIQFEGFKRLGWESDEDRLIRLSRRDWVRRTFQHVWEGYKAKAWGHDELRPISGSFDDPFSGWGATLVDCLDNLLIMNMTQEYNYARNHVRALDWGHVIDFSTINRGRHLTKTEEFSKLKFERPLIPFFETVIRYMGGLISAYDLSGDKLMLERVEDLVKWLLPAFGTQSGFPILRYRMGSNPSGIKSGRVCLAEIGSMTLEFTRLAQLTNKDYYYNLVQRIMDSMDGDQWKSNNRPGSLFPTYIDPDFPMSLSGLYSIGGEADSYYEYLIKEYQLLRGTSPQYKRMFETAVDSINTHLVKRYQLEPGGGKNLTVIGDLAWGSFRPSLDHLACFAGGMIGMGSKLLDRKDYLDLAIDHTDSCVWAYESTKTGVAPEKMMLMEGDDLNRWEQVNFKGKMYRQLRGNPIRGAFTLDPKYIGRPETIESVFYMWRITGDKVWQDRAWRMFTSWVENCLTEFGFADLKDVHGSTARLSDKQESFVLAETLKYYYLLFSEPELISLDDYVFNTEAHPFRVSRPEVNIFESDEERRPRMRSWRESDWSNEARGTKIVKIEDEESIRFIDPKSHQGDDRGGDENVRIGDGTYLQQWSRVDFEKMDEVDLQEFKKAFGIDS